jgi:hypothetical protein
VLDGGAGGFLDRRGVGTGGMRVVAGGAVGFLDVSLFDLGGASVLPLPFSSLAIPLAPLEIGHWCLFAALWDVNFCPHALHCHCGWPSSASSIAFWCCHHHVFSCAKYSLNGSSLYLTRAMLWCVAQSGI